MSCMYLVINGSCVPIGPFSQSLSHISRMCHVVNSALKKFMHYYVNLFLIIICSGVCSWEWSTRGEQILRPCQPNTVFDLVLSFCTVSWSYFDEFKYYSVSISPLLAIASKICRISQSKIMHYVLSVNNKMYILLPGPR